MESLSPESRKLYNLLKSESKEEYEERFAAYKKEMCDAVKVFVDDAQGQLKAVNDSLAEVKSSLHADLHAARAAVGGELEVVKISLSSEIAGLAATLDRVLHPDSVLGPPVMDPGGSATGPRGHSCDLHHRGMTGVPHPSPPVRGTFSDRQPEFHQNFHSFQSQNTDTPPHGPRVDVPQFDGANPKLWQRHCEEYFKRW
jgi:hypothetical protein